MSTPKESNGEDFWVWGGEQNGRFSIRSAYELLQSSQVVSQDPIWKKIWSWSGPSRIQFFIWLTGHGKLLSNSERVRRHIASDASCNRCGEACESLTHVLRECRYADAVWRNLGFDTSNQYWSCNLSSWIRDFLGRACSRTFGITLWYLWKARNELIFSDSHNPADALARKIQSWTKTVADAIDRDARLTQDTTVRSLEQIAWDPGPGDLITVNTDGSVLHQPNRAAAGGIVRSSDGRALGAFVANLGSCSITRAELRGAILGLELAWSLNYREVELQLDSRAVVALLSQTDNPTHQHGLEILAFQELCRRNWVVTVRHVYREANKAADFLANSGHDFPLGTHPFPIFDCNLSYFLRHDVLGIPTPRHILINR
ncbi:Putative ribonuclease H protein At1g65750 [Linum perenne]